MRKLAALVITTLLFSTIGSATATTNQRWDHYRSRLSGNTIIVKGKCIMGEDSAGHLKLISYDDGGGRVVYGCYKRGY